MEAEKHLAGALTLLSPASPSEVNTPRGAYL